MRLHPSGPAPTDVVAADQDLGIDLEPIADGVETAADVVDDSLQVNDVLGLVDQLLKRKK